MLACKLVVHGRHLPLQGIRLAQGRQEELREAVQGAVQRARLAVELVVGQLLCSRRRQICQGLGLGLQAAWQHRPPEALIYIDTIDWMLPSRLVANNIWTAASIASRPAVWQWVHQLGVGIGRAAAGRQVGVVVVLVRELLAAHEQHVLQVVAQALQ